MASIKVLFDARSVRTPAGRYVLRGLTSAWLKDARVGAVMVAIPEEFDRAVLPDGVEPIPFSHRSWVAHMTYALPRLADACRADVIFSPNGIAPRDKRSVAYFQDLAHFKATHTQYRNARALVARRLRASWRAVSSQQWMLAVPVSGEIAAEVRKRVRTRTVTIPNGIDVGTTRWTGCEDRVFVMGGTGSRKDEGTAIEAWARVEAKLRGRTTLVVGGVEPADRRHDFQVLAASLGIDRSTLVLGAMGREEYLEYIASSRLCISCSRLEAFGLPVAEALAIGAPVLATSIQSHIELMERAHAGRAFTPGAVEDLAALVSAALRGEVPPRLLETPSDWSWQARGKQHVDAYLAGL